MRHVEEVIRKIEELKQVVHGANSIYSQSYSEQCEIGKKCAFLEVLQYVINNGFLTESKILELKLQVENEIKENTSEKEYIKNKLKGHLNALIWLLENTEIKNVLLKENNSYENLIKKYNKKINELKIKIIDNKCVLNSLTEE